MRFLRAWIVAVLLSALGYVLFVATGSDASAVPPSWTPSAGRGPPPGASSGAGTAPAQEQARHGGGSGGVELGPGDGGFGG